MFKKSKNLKKIKKIYEIIFGKFSENFQKNLKNFQKI